MKRYQKAIAAVMATLLLISGSVLPASAATKSELEQKLEKLEEQEAQLKKELAGAKSDLSASQKRKNLIDSQIANVQKQIDLLDTQVADMNTKINTVSQQIKEAEQSIADKQASIADTQAKLGARMRAIAKRGNVSALQMLIDTDSYTDYLLKTKVAQVVAARDQATIEAYEAEMAALGVEQDALADKKADLENQKKKLNDLRTSSNEKKTQLDKLYAAAQSEVRQMQSAVSGYNAQLIAKQKEMERTEAEITKLIQSTNSVGKYNNKMMYWPVPTVRAISSVFGPRWGRQHRGLDIANGPIPIYGQNIVAAADGTVIYVNKTSKWGGGYGYYTIVDHGRDEKGRTVTTLYAHCSKVLVSVGQKVVGGKTVLAKAGSTGNVTGPHLHFEVRLNGTAVNPLGTYVSPKVN